MDAPPDSPAAMPIPAADLAAMKQAAAAAAMDYIQAGDVVGVGTGSTAEFFIAGLAKLRGKIDGVVASSAATEARLRALKLPLRELNEVGRVPIYVDGADEATRHLHLIKGGGGALTREKIIAQAAEKFICIADASKLAPMLGAFPLPVEVIPMARSMTARELVKLGGQPELRATAAGENFTTDNGHYILDIRNLKIPNPPDMERRLNQIPGVVTVGLFALRGADKLLLGGTNGVEVLAK